MKVAVIDYGMGNLGSITNMVRRIEAVPVIASEPVELEDADRIILPGVGAFDTGMHRLRERGFIPVLERKVLRDGTPLLGICLGMQLLTRGSEEGRQEGLGWIEAHTCRFDRDRTPEPARFKVPHMGWNIVRVRHPTSLFPDPTEEQRFYFVHSFHVTCENEADVVATAHYGYDFAAAVATGPIAGVQFHPEKSHRFGMRLLTRFLWER